MHVKKLHKNASCSHTKSSQIEKKQIFISDLLLPLDFVDVPQTGVEECLDLSLHHLCCPPCFTSIKQTDFTLELKMRSLVLMLIPPDVQMFMSIMKAALALPILAVTSRSVPPCWSTTLPS